MVTIDPKYSNFANAEEDSSDSESQTTFEFRFKVGDVIDITTAEDYFGRHGQVDDILIRPGKNIVADLFYDGEIKCRDFEDYSDIGDHPDYPCVNPLFYSENLEVVREGHYRFRTQLAPKKNFRFYSLKSTIEHTPDAIKAKYVYARRLPDPINGMFDPSKPYDNLEHVLDAVTDFICEHNSEDERNDGFYSYEEILGEYLSTGKFRGDCKAISTFTAGILNGLGLAARVIDGDLVDTRPRGANRDGHVWPEVYVPMSREKGFWIPADTSRIILKHYPTSERVYLYCRVALPEFLDKAVTTAKLRITYE